MTQPPQRLSFRSDEIAEEAVDRLVEVLDLQAGLPGIQRLRAWERSALAVRPGERALDVGSGTGSEVQHLADLVGPDGDAVGVEPNDWMRTVAEERAAQASSRARFVSGLASDLPFADGAFDIVRCERVFQHLNEPELAATEIARVLRPGGRTVVTDTDWETAILHPLDREIAAAVAEMMLANMTNPRSGRRLPGLLTAAGLTVEDVGSQALIWPASVVEGPFVQMMMAQSIESGILAEEQAARLLADLRAGVARGDFHMSVTMFAVLATKG
ncbi:methyltransferase domain-containing protein [Skermania sp. ID1734]|uniref:methyltransferase domain-containing protein n=1 Tax=Skermania sp. ID1734 TaxID=2597516 RepID=UPI00117DAA93|nr:methyltransferase domain-containing protein [Skermania sp. ID1734]TSD95291.1 methyltransferase domain-containing protein [Skermania sp. ID1734]